MAEKKKKNQETEEVSFDDLPIMDPGATSQDNDEGDELEDIEE